MITDILKELHSYLKKCMISGTGLLFEDMRLKRVAEELQKYEAFAPVLAKISQSVQGLIDPAGEEKGELLIETFTLLEEVFCTQAKVSVEGEPDPLRVWPDNPNYTLTQIKDLYAALTVSGKKRKQYVLHAHRKTPELFRDIRICAALIKIADSDCNGLGFYAKDWLLQGPPEMLSLLQEDFDPEGNKGMVFRLELMEDMAGGNCNEFYVRMLPRSKRAVKTALIHALRYSVDNVELLFELAKKEKGNVQAMVYSSIASIEDERCEQFIRKLYETKPKEAVLACYDSSTRHASDFVAECLMEQLKLCKDLGYGTGDKIFDIEQIRFLAGTLHAFPGKSGEKTCEAIRMAAGIKEIYYRKGRELKGWKSVYYDGFSKKCGTRRFCCTFSERMATLLEWMLYKNPTEDLYRLAEELYEKNVEYFGAVWMAKLSQPDGISWLREQLFTEDAGERKPKPELKDYARDAFRNIMFHEGDREYYIQDPEEYAHERRKEQLKHKVNREFVKEMMELMMAYAYEEVDRDLQELIDEKDAAMCKRLGDFFYHRLKISSDFYTCYFALGTCGHKAHDGIDDILRDRAKNMRTPMRFNILNLSQYEDQAMADAIKDYVEQEEGETEQNE